MDFGLDATVSWLPQGEALRPQPLAPRTHAPLLLPRDPRLWSCTSPVPAVDPDVPLYLHGPDATPADLQIAWRKELDGAHPAEWQHWIEACPPVPGEVMQISIGEAGRWLNASAVGDIADVEGRGGKESEAHGDRRPFRIWRNRKSAP